MRGTSNANVRGNSKQRAARRAWLLKVFESDQGEGTCRCYRCGKVLTEGGEVKVTETSGNSTIIYLAEYALTVDRIIPGAQGGTYARNNIRPACLRCNMETGGAVRRRKKP